MAEEIDLNSNDASQNLYADSDLAPLSSLFGEMAADRSFGTKIKNWSNFVGDLGTAVVTTRSKYSFCWFRWLGWRKRG